MNQPDLNTADEKLDAVCLIGSAVGGVIVYFGSILLLMLTTFVILSACGYDGVPTWWPRIHLPWYIYAPLWAFGVCWVGSKLYPKCRRRRG
jgi:hypothetical protein